MDIATFRAQVARASGPVLVDFWAPWCGYCTQMAPAIEQVAEQYRDRATVIKVNVDDSPEIARTYGIRSIPQLLFFDGGALVGRTMKVRTARGLSSILDSILAGELAPGDNLLDHGPTPPQDHGLH